MMVTAAIARRAFSFVCFVLMIHHSTDAANILMNAILGKGSHFYLSAAIGEQLVQRSHNVTFLVSNAFIGQAYSSRYGKMFNFEVFTHPFPVSEVHEMFGNLSLSFFKEKGFLNNPEIAAQKRLLRARFEDCKSLFENEELLNRLRSTNFSVVIYDVTWLCGALVAEELGIPHVAVVPFPGPCFFTAAEGSDCNPALIPSMLTSFSNKMNFLQRLTNTFVSLFAKSILPHLILWPYRSLTARFDDIGQPWHVPGRSKLWLVNSDFVAEPPCALAPNVIPVGGLTVMDPEELPSDLEEFVQGSGDHGTIICAFGSFITFSDAHLPILHAFLNAFGRLPQRVVWQLKDTPPFPIPSNVRIQSWLPLNDLLGHMRTKAIFYHGGHNTFYEAIYHGVPTVTMSIFGDQRVQAAKSVSLGMGLSLDKDRTADAVFNALHEITTNTSYACTAKRLSAIFRDRPMRPAERAAFWVDHSIKYGADYLEIAADHLNWFQYYLLDVIAFSAAVVMATIFIVVKCVGCICRRTCSSRFKSKTD